MWGSSVYGWVLGAQRLGFVILGLVLRAMVYGS